MDINEMMDKHAQSMAQSNNPAPTPEVSSEGEGTPESSVETPETPEGSAKSEEPESPQSTDSSADGEGEPEGNPETPATPEAQQPDYDKFLEVSSDGLFKSVDDFKSSLDKVRGYEELKQKLEEKENENPFANDYVAKLNKLFKEGKTEDQIDTFNKLQRLGDISKLDPFEAKVQKLIFDGYTRGAAERKINKEFGLNIEIEGDHLDESEIAQNKQLLEDAKEDLRISAKSDIQFLQDLVAKIESPDDKAQTDNLQEIANKKAYEKKLEPFVNDLASSYEKEVKIKAKVDGNDIDYSLSFDDDFRMDVASMAKEFFMENPVNEENIRSFKDFANATYVSKNLTSKIIPDAINHGISLGRKQAVEEFENKSGLPVSGQAPVTNDMEAMIREQQRKVATGEI